MANSEETGNDIIIYQCMGASCRKKKGNLLDHYIKRYKLQGKVSKAVIGCSDRCSKAPVLHLHPDDKWFSEKDLGSIFKKYILNK